MPISATIYLPSQDNTNWRERATGSQGNNKVKAQHAERMLFTNVPKTSPSAYLIVQNAFPCAECSGWFTAQSANYSIVIKVIGNEGCYSAEHGLGQNAATPCIFYYHKQKVRLVGMWSRGAFADPLAGFPAFPDVTHF